MADWDYSQDGVVLDNQYYYIPKKCYYKEDYND